MTSEWQVLVELRERRERSAREKVLAERRSSEQRRDEAQRAHVDWQQRVAAQGDHWQATRVAGTGGALNIAQLRQAAAWGGVLASQAAAQRGVAEQAQAAAQQQERLLDASRDGLRAATASVAKLTHLQRQARARRALADDARLDSAVDDLAAARWSAGRKR